MGMSMGQQNSSTNLTRRVQDHSHIIHIMFDRGIAITCVFCRIAGREEALEAPYGMHHRAIDLLDSVCRKPEHVFVL